MIRPHRSPGEAYETREQGLLEKGYRSTMGQNENAIFFTLCKELSMFSIHILWDSSREPGEPPAGRQPAA